MLYSSWSYVAPALACRSTFWAAVTLNHVRHGLIDSAFLAANGGNLPGGAERIDFALNDRSNSGPQRVDNCVRTVLRRLGGLPEVRGNRSVYVDCPFARAWWRERMIEQASEGRDDVAREHPDGDSHQSDLLGEIHRSDCFPGIRHSGRRISGVPSCVHSEGLYGTILVRHWKVPRACSGPVGGRLHIKGVGN